MQRTRTAHRAALGLVAFVLAACGGTPPPAPGVSSGAAPDMRGRRVMLLPVQQTVGVPGDPTAELTFALTSAGAEVDWVLEEEVNEVLARSPGIQARTRGLPVSMFGAAQVERVGDPLYGQLRRMTGLVDAEYIVLPILASWEANETVIDAEPRVRYTVAVIQARTGYVRWFGVEEGGDFGRNDPRALASAAENMARTMFWYMHPGTGI